MTKTKKISVISVLLLLILFAAVILIKNKNVEPNIYLEQTKEQIEVNFAETSGGANVGNKYLALEEINESPESVFSLSICNTVINDPGSVSRFKNLERLDISDCEINDFSFKKNYRT